MNEVLIICMFSILLSLSTLVIALKAQLKAIIGISPTFVFLSMFIFYQLLPTILFSLGIFPYGLQPLSENVLWRTLFLSLLALSAFLFSYSLRIRITTKYRVPDISDRLWLIAIISILMSLFLKIIAYMLMKDSVLTNNLNAISLFLIVGSSFLLLIRCLKHYPRHFYLNVLMLAITTISSFYGLMETGNRRHVLGYILFLLQLVFVLKKIRIKIIYILLVIPIFIFLIIGIRAFRTVNQFEHFSTEKLIFYMKEGLSDMRAFSTAIDSPTCFFFFGRIVEDVPKQTNYLFGLSYYRVLFFPIPRSFWHNKPIKLTQMLGPVFWKPYEHVSTGATLVGESYINFGTIGVIFIFAIWGVIIFNLEENLKLLTTNDSISKIVFNIFMLLWIPDIFRGGGFSSSLSGQLVTFGFPLVLILLFSLLKRR